MFKITEAWKNRKAVINLCNEANACNDQFTLLKKALSQTEFEEVLLRNFSWCVKNKILVEWLPDSLPNCAVLDCSGCTGLKSLPDLPNCIKLYCSGCTGLKSLPDLPNCTVLDCSGFTGLNE